MDREGIRILDARRIDALMALHMRETGKPVAQHGGALEIKVFCGLSHGMRDLLLHGLALAREEIARFRNQLGIVGGADLPRAGAGTALDLIEQTGPRAPLIGAVGAGAQKERALQRVDRAGDGDRRGEGAEVIALAGAGAAMLVDRRGRVIARQQDIGKRLVVAQQNVKARRKRLMRFASSRSASVSVRVVTNSMAVVAATIWAMRFE